MHTHILKCAFKLSHTEDEKFLALRNKSNKFKCSLEFPAQKAALFSGNPDLGKFQQVEFCSEDFQNNFPPTFHVLIFLSPHSEDFLNYRPTFHALVFQVHTLPRNHELDLFNFWTQLVEVVNVKRCTISIYIIRFK